MKGLNTYRLLLFDYDPESKEHQNRYTFQLIENSLEKAKLKDEVENIIEIIVFDALIGNGDRHQENWAIISRQKLVYEAIEELEHTGEIGKTKGRIQSFMILMKNHMKSMYKDKKEKGQKLPKFFYMIENNFAPIYDSGSSLGRELLDEKVEVLLHSVEELNKYLNKGLSEIHWEGKKINHFELIEHLLHSPLYNETVKTTIKRVLQKWDGPKIKQMVQEVDKLVPESHIIYKIPDSRKELIFKIITLRYNRLKALIHERV